jgi:hypothetical protein
MSSTSEPNSSSSFSLADDVQEDPATAALLQGGIASMEKGGGASSSVLAAMMRDISDLHGDEVATCSSQNAASPVQPLDSVFQSTASLAHGRGGLDGTIRRMVIDQLDSPDHHAVRRSQTNGSHVVGVHAQSTSGLDSEELLATLSDAGPVNFEATAVGGPAPAEVKACSPPRDAYDDTFEMDADTESEDGDEDAITHELAAKKHSIALRAQRDAIDEDEYAARREVEDDERIQGWRGSTDGGLSQLFQWFHEQTEVMEAELERREETEAHEISTWDAIHQILREEANALWVAKMDGLVDACIDDEVRLRSTILLEESSHATRLDAVQSGLTHTCSLICEERDGREAIQNEDETWIEKISAREASDRHQASERQRWREERTVAILKELTETRSEVEADAMSGAVVMYAACLALIGLFVDESRALQQLERDECVGRLEAEYNETMRLMEGWISAMHADEATGRKALVGEEWDRRRPLYDAHRKSMLLFRPRKPPVPRLSRKNYIPTPPVKPMNVAQTYGVSYTTPSTADVGRPRIPKVRPLPLKRLPPYEDPTQLGSALHSGGRMSAVSVDEGVGRKAIGTREQHQWFSLLSLFRHGTRDLDHEATTQEEVSLQQAYQHGKEPFRVSQHEYDRYRALREEAKRRRAYVEERFRLQALVSRLIAVDVAFETKLAMRTSKSHPATSVRKPRPPFHCGRVDADGAKRCAWEVIPRLCNAADGSPSPKQRHRISPERTATNSPQTSLRQRPRTAGAAQSQAARPPQAPRPVQSARPPRVRSSVAAGHQHEQRESFGQRLDRKLEEALLDASPVRGDSPPTSSRASSPPGTPPSSSKSSSRASSASSRSSSRPTSSHHADSFVEHEDNTPPQSATRARDDTTLADTTYGDESFVSMPASPEKAAEDNEADAQQTDDVDGGHAQTGEAMGSRDAKEEVVYSLIHHDSSLTKLSTPQPPRRSSASTSSSSRRSTPPDTQAEHQEDGDESLPVHRSASSASSKSTSSSGSWHPMIS